MSNREKAWSTVEKVTGWRPYGPSENVTPTAHRVNEILRSLQQERLTIRAIDLIGDLLNAHTAYLLENSWCAECDTRMDGTQPCVGCNEHIDTGSLDQSTGLCLSCLESSTCCECGIDLRDGEEQMCEDCIREKE